ncbi:MAG: hypothetical protein P8Y94_12470 [Acidobacteriota bacterium]
MRPLLDIMDINLYSRVQAGSHMVKKLSLFLGIVALLCVPMVSAASEGQSPTAADNSGSTSHVYVAPNVLQLGANQIFSSFTLTNTTPYWFNLHIYFVNTDGEVVRDFSPLLKGFATWQKPSTEFLADDFQGSIWIVSPQPIVASAFIFQLDSKAGSLTLLGNNKLDEVAPESADDALQLLLNR